MAHAGTARKGANTLASPAILRFLYGNFTKGAVPLEFFLPSRQVRLSCAALSDALLTWPVAHACSDSCHTRSYTDADVTLLAEVNTLHSTLSGPATKKLMERVLLVFGDVRFERLAGIPRRFLPCRHAPWQCTGGC